MGIDTIEGLGGCSVGVGAGGSDVRACGRIAAGAYIGGGIEGAVSAAAALEVARGVTAATSTLAGVEAMTGAGW